MTLEVRLNLLLTVAVVSAAGLAVFVLAAWAFRVREVSDVLSLMKRMSRRFTARSSRREDSA